MKIDFNGMLYALSYALDCLEGELIGVEPGHAKWVAYLCVKMGKEYGMGREELLDLAACAALHDNALTQYAAEEKPELLLHQKVLGRHCIIGEENVKEFPFHTDVTNVILYHHENADGSGFFKKMPQEVPLMAQFIHLADMLDVSCRVSDVSEETYEKICCYIQEKQGKLFDKTIIELFDAALPKEVYLSCKGKKITSLLSAELPGEVQEYPFESVEHIMRVFGRIVDYKSPFTRKHSEGIAEKLVKMAEIYGYDKATQERLFVAGVLHDIGKMAIRNDVLEKPDKLTDTEFVHMKNHAWYTYVILSEIDGFEDITRWAAHHHEKLDGSGYPFGLTGEQMDEKERLTACVDIYQALSEERPYKPAMPREKCFAIMRDMVQKGLIDGKITEDLYQAGI